DVKANLETASADERTVDRLIADLIPAEPRLLVGMHPGSGRPVKCWPPESFAQIADRFVDSFGATVLVFGGRQDEALVAKVLAQVRRRDRVVSLANQLNVPQLVAALRRLDFFVGNDSGPTHLAGASGVPTLGVYAATVDPAQWAPLGPLA